MDIVITIRTAEHPYLSALDQRILRTLLGEAPATPEGTTEPATAPEPTKDTAPTPAPRKARTPRQPAETPAEPTAPATASPAVADNPVEPETEDVMGSDEPTITKQDVNARAQALVAANKVPEVKQALATATEGAVGRVANLTPEQYKPFMEALDALGV